MMANTDLPKSLFKYKSFDNYTADILRKGEAYFCPAQMLDDQFESAISISKKILNNDIDGYMKELMPFILEKVLPQTSLALKDLDISTFYQNGKLNDKKFKAVVLENDSSIEHSKLDKIVNYLKSLQKIENNPKLCKAIKRMVNIKNEVGVFSLTTRNNNQPMWAWYADGYKGFVIEYDIETYLKCSEKNIKDLKQVNYCNKRNNNPMHIVLNLFYDALYKSLKIRHQAYDVEKNLIDVVNTKSVDWSFQEEWRFFGKPETKAIINIKAIYIGVNASEANKDFVLKIGKEKGYEIYQQLNDCETCDIEFERIM